MSTTYPSRFLTIVDFPEPRGLSVKFKYNFFTRDERINDEGAEVDSGQINPDEIPDLRNQVPRFVKISWKPVFVKGCKIRNEFVSEGSENGVTRINGMEMFNAKNAEFIHDELVFSNFDYTAINFQDTGLDGKLSELISGSVRLRNITETTPTEAAKIINDFTRATVDGNEIIDAANNLQACGILFVQPEKKEQIKRTVYDRLKELSIHTQINNKIVGTLVRSVAEDSLNLYADEMSEIVGTANRLQSKALEKLSSTSVGSLEWDTGFEPIIQKRINTDASSFEISDIQSVGYLVEKEEISGNGNVITFDPFLVNGKNSTTVIDSEVKYGSVYRYRVRSVAAVILPAKDTEGHPVLAAGLVASQAGHTKVIRCVENVPPPAPADFSVTWDYEKRAARLLWSFPVNSQRDIKYFQIFRRRNLNEPFEMIREYDFDDSAVIVDSGKRIKKSLTYKMRDPRTFFIDREFTKDSKFIYALCCVDAHGLTSNYSIQYHVSFDKFRNKMVVKLFSKAGAPIAFPNMYLQNETFLDTMKTSGFERAQIYFDPEYLRVRDFDKEDLKFLPLDDPYALYKLQIINTDFQTSQVVDFAIDDRRTNDETSTSEGGSRQRKIKTKLTKQSGLG